MPKTAQRRSFSWSCRLSCPFGKSGTDHAKYPGVSWSQSARKWKAFYKRHYLGAYDKESDAAEAVRKAKEDPAEIQAIRVAQRRRFMSINEALKLSMDEALKLDENPFSLKGMDLHTQEYREMKGKQQKWKKRKGDGGI